MAHVAKQPEYGNFFLLFALLSCGVSEFQPAALSFCQSTDDTRGLSSLLEHRMAVFWFGFFFFLFAVHSDHGKRIQ